MTKKQTKVITILTIIAFILAILVCNRIWIRFDMTHNKAHTISKESRNIHKDLIETLSITYYISDKLKNADPKMGEIEDTLKEYTAYSKGKMHLSIVDPVKADLTMMIEGFGLQSRPLPIMEKDQQSLITVYSGIVLKYLDSVEIIPWVNSTNNLESKLTSRIRSMIMNRERWIGVIVGDSYRGWREDFAYLNNALVEDGYRVRLISAGDEIPDNAPGLFVFGGVEDFDEWTLYRIDRYIQLGGRVLFASDAVFVDTLYSTLDPRMLSNKGLLDMIAAYGVIIRPELVLDKNAQIMQYPSRTQAGSTVIKRVPYPLWIGVTGENGNIKHPVSSGFQGLDLFWASPLELAPVSSVEAVPLFTSSPNAWLMRDGYYTNPEVAYALELEASWTTGVKILGASLTGVFPSFFREGVKPVREDSNEELPDMPLQAKPSRVIVIGDVDFATNMLSYTGAEYNLEFLVRTADYLINDEDIIKIRNNQGQAKFKVTDQKRINSAMRFSQIVNVGLVPLFVIICGLLFSNYRRKKAVKTALAAKTALADQTANEIKTEDARQNMESDNEL